MNDLKQIVAELEAAKARAEKAEQPLLVYLISMAILEAEEQTRLREPPTTRH